MFLRKLTNESINEIYNNQQKVIIAYNFVNFLMIFTIIFIYLMIKIIVEPNNIILVFTAIFLFVLIMICFEFIYYLD